MPELPEVEALRRVARRPGLGVPDREGRARAHRDAEDVRPAAPRRSKAGGSPVRCAAGKRLLFPTEDGELVLLLHMMSAGRIKYLAAGEKGPKSPAFQLEFQGGGRLVMTEGGPKKRAGAWLLSPEAAEAEVGAPRARGARPRPGAARRDPGRRLAPAALAAARPAAARRDRPRLGERDPQRRRALALRALDAALAGGGRAAGGGDRLGVLARAGGARARGGRQDRLPRPQTPRRAVPALRRAIAQVDYDEHTVFYCPKCQTGGRILKDRRLSRLLR